MQRQYPLDVERAKMKNLTDLFEHSFGMFPHSFRAGRYGLSHGTGKILMELGYKVDSSVTPHICWKDPYVKDAPDFSMLPERPYRVCESGDIWRTGSGPLLEIPITVRLWKRKLSRFWRKQVRWFRPWYSSDEDLCAIIDNEAGREQEEQRESLLVMMFHNMEVIPGASPYPQTEGDVERYLSSLRCVLSRAGKFGVKFSTMREYYNCECIGGCVEQ
jgi:hypothetical protein